MKVDAKKWKRLFDLLSKFGFGNVVFKVKNGNLSLGETEYGQVSGQGFAIEFEKNDVDFPEGTWKYDVEYIRTALSPMKGEIKITIDEVKGILKLCDDFFEDGLTVTIARVTEGGEE